MFVKNIGNACDLVAGCLQKEPSYVWNSVDVHDIYWSYNGVLLSRRQSVKSLSERLGKDLLVLSSEGIVSILVFKSKAAGHLKLVANDDEHDVELMLMKMAKKIVAEKSI